MERLKASLKKTIERNKEANLQIKSDDEYFLEEFTKVNLKGSKKAANEDICPNSIPDYQQKPTNSSKNYAKKLVHNFYRDAQDHIR